MLVRHVVVTGNIIAIPSGTLMVEASRIMEFQRIERLAVVDINESWLAL